MLKKEINTQYGAKAKYWVVSKVTIDRVNLMAIIEIYGYVSKEAEQQKKKHIDERTFYVNFVEQASEEEIQKIIPDQIITEDILNTFQKISELSYGIVVQSEEFSDAENI